MKLSARYGSHLPALLQALSVTSGAVLELGAGLTSTPLLSAWCKMQGRDLLTVENDVRVYQWAMQYCAGPHKVVYVRDWDKADIDRPWDVALVDHSPAERRVVEIKRLAHLARILVVHDSNGRWEKDYHYSTIYPLFKYRYTFDKLTPSTVLLSNLMPLDDLWVFHRNWKTRKVEF